mgnify:FL=1|jgi:tetratricopeptide (TPR) repeat protein
MKKSLRLKIVIGLALLTLTTSAFADAKSDYDQAMQYAKENKIDDAVKVLETLSTSKDKQYSIKANYELGMFHLSKKDYSKAKSYFLLATKDKTNSTAEALGSLFNLSLISVEEKDNKTAENYILDMKKRTQEKDAQVLEISGNFNLFVKNDFVKAEEEFKKAISISPKELKYQADLLELYEAKQDEAAISNTIASMKLVNSEVSNQEIGKYFESMGNYVLANKYYTKSFTEDKNEMSKLLLGIMYYNLGKKDEGKKLIQESQKAGVKEAGNILEQIKTEESKKK